MSTARVVLLGPQFHQPTVGSVLRSLAVDGPVATITAGWQESEAEAAELSRQLEGADVPLRLYERAERVWAADPELAAAHRAMQVELRTLRRLYNEQLEPAAQAWVRLLEADAPEHLVQPERDAALDTIRRIDARLLDRIGAIRRAFEERFRPLDRPAVAATRAQVEAELARCEAVVIEGGHVAVLLNRIQLFGLGEFLAGKTLIGCAAGAMVLCRRVVLYNDRPAIGRGHAEVALSGLDLAPGLVALPDATYRLRVDEPERMRKLSLRLAPDVCALLDPGARLDWDGRTWTGSHTSRILADGTVEPWAEAA